MVVAGPGLEAGGRSGRLNSPEESRLGEGVEPVVDRLMGDRSESPIRRRLNCIGGAVGVGRDGLENGHALRGHLEAVVAKELGGVSGHDRTL